MPANFTNCFLMLPEIKLTDVSVPHEGLILLAKDHESAKSFFQGMPEELVIANKIAGRTGIIPLDLPERTIILYLESISSINQPVRNEALRKAGAEAAEAIEKRKLKTVFITGAPETDALLFLEGMLLSSYRFLKHKNKPEIASLSTILLNKDICHESALTELLNLVQGVNIARDLVNEPVSYLTAEKLAEVFQKLGEEAGFNVEVLNKTKIESLKMGGLIAVNLGSPNPPTFSILEYKPEKPVNTNPYVLVGKGVVYDTGGLSLKPTPNSMDKMKSDMAGSAAVAGAIYAIARNKLPLHVIGLIPATENRPDGNAMAPGDVITMFDGTTVEVLNTDAEGRLILADALSFAKKYNPALTIDLATLTGAAARAIGKEGIVYMGNASENIKKAFTASGNEVYERLVEFPLWEEYKKQLESDIADLKNIGSGEAGAITAGKFLEHFVSYPWLHLDIAGSAFLDSRDSYRGKNATGTGVRLLYNFFKKMSN